jgi:hypothetical protein
MPARNVGEKYTWKWVLEIFVIVVSGASGVPGVSYFSLSSG